VTRLAAPTPGSRACSDQRRRRVRRPQPRLDPDRHRPPPARAARADAPLGAQSPAGPPSPGSPRRGERQGNRQAVPGHRGACPPGTGPRPPPWPARAPAARAAPSASPLPLAAVHRPATDLVAFSRPHPLAEQHRYCTAHAVEAASAGASRPAQVTLPRIGEPAQPMSIRYPCEQCGARFRRRSQGNSLLCPGCRERRDHAWPTAGLVPWLAAQYAEAYANLYAEHHAKAAPRTRDGRARAVRARARSRVLGELQRQHPDDYRRRYETELARACRIGAGRSAAGGSPARRAEGAVLARTRRARPAARSCQRRRPAAGVAWLTERYPDSAAEVFRAQAARLPFNPADRTQPGAARLPGPGPLTSSAACTRLSSKPATVQSMPEWPGCSVEAMAMPAKYGQPLDAHLLDPLHPHNGRQRPIDVTCRTLQLLPTCLPPSSPQVRRTISGTFQAGAVEREAIESVLGSRTYV
jgi:hypothetical protein